jgi:hypothetical protein
VMCEESSTELTPKDFDLELNTKNLVNSTSFLTITHAPMSARRFRTAEF